MAVTTINETGTSTRDHGFARAREIFSQWWLGYVAYHNREVTAAILRTANQYAGQRRALRQAA